MSSESILVIDDEPGVRSALEGILTDEGFAVVSVESGEQGLEALEREEFDAVLLDVWLPGIDGLKTLERIRERTPDVEVVMISGHGTIETAVNATKLGAFDFVEKPLSLDKTLLVLRNALRQRRLERMNLQLLEQLSRDTEIVGRSVAAERLRKAVEVAARSDSSVLVCGEPGSGRENVARRVHSSSRRSEAPFVDVPCAALAPAAAEAALYGSVDTPGRIGLSLGGSLFLEDVESLVPALQLRLAASLESSDGGAGRALASTGFDTQRIVPALRQRLDVIRIRVPALRERREDVALLAERFMRELSREYGRETKRLSPECLRALRAHDWPGNIRELRNLMEHLLLFVDEETVRLEDLPEGLGGARGAVEDLHGEFPTLAAGVRAFERYYIARVMSDQGADVQAAARRLGLRVDRLRRKLREM